MPKWFRGPSYLGRRMAETAYRRDDIGLIKYSSAVVGESLLGASSASLSTMVLQEYSTGINSVPDLMLPVADEVLLLGRWLLAIAAAATPPLLAIRAEDRRTQELQFIPETRESLAERLNRRKIVV